MKYLFKRKLIEGSILSRPNRFIMLVEVGGKAVKCHCPSTGRIGSIDFKGIPCLLSKSSTPGRKTAYTVEAFSLDPAGKKRKAWIGINQNDSNRYVEFFLKGGALSKMISRGEEAKRERILGKSRIDFSIGDRDFIEVKTPLMDIPCEGHPRYKKSVSKFIHFQRLVKHFGELGRSIGKGSRAIVILCFIYPAKRFVVPKTTRGTFRISRAARKAERKGLEYWQLNLKIGPEGVSLSDCFKLDLFRKR